MEEVPDYSSYSLHTLEDILKHIDQVKYPDRVKIVEEEISKKKAILKSQIASVEDEPISEEVKKSKSIDLIIFASTIFLLSLYTVFSLRQNIIDHIITAALIPLAILVLSAISIFLLFRGKYIGVEVLMYTQIPLAVSVLIGKFYYFCNLGILVFFGISFGEKISFISQFDIGNFLFIFGNVDSEYSFSFGVNLIPLVLFIYLKLRLGFYRRIFNEV